MSDKSFDLNTASFTTRAIHVAQRPESWISNPVATPIMMVSNFTLDIDRETQEWVYTRTGNPNRQILEKCLASLDGGTFGLCCSTGLGALTVMLSSLLKTGDHFIYGEDLYGGSSGQIAKMIDQWGLEGTCVDTSDLTNFEKHIKKNTKLVFIETPTNPFLKVTDLRKLSSITKRHNLILAVDNSFLTSYFQRPLQFGADIVMYSLSKYMNGHSDVVMGALVTNNEEIYQKMKPTHNLMGISPSPFDCWLVNRSLKTLALRMDRHMQNGLIVAKFLVNHPAVTNVIHTGLPSHPQFELTQRQTNGHNGMITFYLKGGIEEVKTFVKSLKLIRYAGSLGGPETVVEVPTLLSHEKLSQEKKLRLGVTDNLVRMSVGTESSEDIIKDLDQALRTATKL